MANVVYLLSSLPSLSFGHSPPISMKNFLSEAKLQLSAHDYIKVSDIDLNDMASNKFGKLKSLVAAMELLKADQLEMRHARLNDRTAAIKTLPVSIADENPLEREKSMMRWQWDQLSELDSSTQFYLSEVFAYKLKLQILLRLDSFNEEKGSKLLGKLVNPPELMEDL